MNAKLIALFVVFTSIQITWAQEENQPEKRKIVSIEEKDNITKVNIPGISVEVNEGNDTIVKVSMGQKRYQVIETDGKTYLSEERLPQKRFKGHYSSITLGFNWLVDPDFKSSFSSEADFMELSVGKSMSFGINPLQYSIGLQKDKNTIGLVLGAGWTVHNYRFDHNFRIIKDANGNVLQDGDTVVVIKDLKVKGSSSVVKVGTKVKNIRLTDGGDGHDIACKIDGFGAMNLKSEFVKKA